LDDLLCGVFWFLRKNSLYTKVVRFSFNQRTEIRGQKTEDRRQRTEDRGQKTAGRGQRAEDRRTEEKLEV